MLDLINIYIHRESSKFSQYSYICALLNIDIAVCKDFGKSKFKFLLNKALKNNFLNVWNKIRNTYLLDKGKLNTYFKYKTSFNLEKIGIPRVAILISIVFIFTKCSI
jgi:ABC-type long-subunit fatty acid transport system fused permease/ATPase subunit